MTYIALSLARSGIRTLNLGFTRQVFYHCHSVSFFYFVFLLLFLQKNAEINRSLFKKYRIRICNKISIKLTKFTKKCKFFKYQQTANHIMFFLRHGLGLELLTLGLRDKYSTTVILCHSFILSFCSYFYQKNAKTNPGLFKKCRITICNKISIKLTKFTKKCKFFKNQQTAWRILLFLWHGLRLELSTLGLRDKCSTTVILCHSFILSFCSHFYQKC